MPKSSFQQIHLAYVALLIVSPLVLGEKFKSPCGTAAQMSQRIGVCLQPIFDMVEGKIPDPKGDQDILVTCEKFQNTEKCIRTIAKDCLTGLHKTSVGTVASATKRFRTQECKNVQSRARYIEPLRCAIKLGKQMEAMFRNHTAIEQAVLKLNIPPEEKLIKSCCVLSAMDREIARLFDRDCPASTSLALGIVKGITEDARNTLCHNPKCKGVLDAPMRTARYKPPQNFIEPVMQVLFELNTD